MTHDLYPRHMTLDADERYCDRLPNRSRRGPVRFPDAMLAPESLSLDKAIARMAVVVDPMLLLQLLDVLEVGLRVRSYSLERVQQCFLETAAEAHAFVLGQIEE
jgi:hypothetical protein